MEQDLGRPIIKSMNIDFQGLSRIDNGCNMPARNWSKGLYFYIYDSSWSIFLPIFAYPSNRSDL